MTDKLLYDIDAEEAVLGSMLIDSEAYYKIAYLKPEDFSREKNKWVFEAIIGLLNHGIACTSLTVAHELGNKQRLEAIGGAAYLAHLESITPTSVYITHYADIVKRFADYRRLLTASAQIEGIVYSGELDFDKSLSDCLRLITGLKKNVRARVRTGKDRASRAIDTYSDYADGTIERTKFGIPSLDKLGGMGPGEYIILCGETKMGKSTITKQIADYVAKSGPVLYFRGEMTEDQWNQRDLARIMRQPMKHLASEQFIKDRLDDIIKATGAIAESNILTIGGSVTAEDLYAEAVNIDGLRLVIVDYLQLLKGVTADYKATSQASSSLARMAKDLNIPVLTLSQLARDNAKKPEDKKHWTQRLKDSGNIENDADWVLNISRDQDAQPGTKGFLEATLAIGYHRQGGERMPIPLRFEWQDQIYMEVAQ